MTLKEFLKLEGKAGKPLTIAVQGFGNVGAFFALVAAEECPEWKLIAVSDSRTTVVNDDGLDAKALAALKQEKKSFSEYKKASLKPSEEIFKVEADVLVLAALDNAVTDENMNKVQARILVELANGPIDESAEHYLLDKGIQILPDVVANAGGVIVSYLEWLQNRSNETWDEPRVNQELQKYMNDAVDAMYAYATEHDYSYKEAALSLAINRLV